MTIDAWPCHSVAMPIEVGDVRGVTSNVSADNVVFDSPASFAVGTAIDFVIAPPSAGAAPLRLYCRGVVTAERVRGDGRFETSATIDLLRILPLER
ncbi:MAG TPA: hypothetical protein VG323_22525 [Thermoanaerobaculia bacterium]|nr:hypothetical protein [Thermoanaerobaculia bacterium]